MSTFLEIILVGHLGADAELKYTPNDGLAFCEFRIAINRRAKIQNEWRDETSWYRVTVWGKTAENLVDYLKKGTQVLVISNNFEARPYMDKDNQARVDLRVTAQTVRLLGSRSGNEQRYDDTPSYTKNDSRNSNAGYANETRTSGGTKGKSSAKPTHYDDFPDDRPESVDDIPF